MTEDVAVNEPFAVKEIDLSANTILTANFLASYTNGGPLSGDFAEAWFTVPVFGDKVNVTIGAKATLDGNVSLFFGQPTDASLGGGGRALATTPRSGAFATGPLRSQPDPTYLFLTANWTTSAGSEPQLVVTSGAGETSATGATGTGGKVDRPREILAFEHACMLALPGLSVWSDLDVERPCRAGLVCNMPCFVGNCCGCDENSSGLVLKRSRAHGTSITASITM